MNATGGPRNTPPGTLTALFFDACRKFDKPDALQVKIAGTYRPISHRQLLERVRSVARAYVGFVSHILGHGNWEHLIGNFMLILLLGPILEERHGSGSLLIMVLITALFTGIACHALFPTVPVWVFTVVAVTSSGRRKALMKPVPCGMAARLSVVQTNSAAAMPV